MLLGKFFFHLLVAGIVFRLVCPLVILLLFGLALFTNRNLLIPAEGNGPRARRISAGSVSIALCFLGTLYVACGWVAFAAVLSAHYSQLPEVSHHWLYYLIGGCLCLGVLATMDDIKNITPHSLFAMIAFVVICFWPPLVQWPYGWFLNRIIGNPAVTTTPANEAIDRCRAAAAKKDWDSAVKEYPNAIRLNPKLADAWRALGMVRSEKHEGDRPDAAGRGETILKYRIPCSHLRQ
jgi:hypothetical protein